MCFDLAKFRNHLEKVLCYEQFYFSHQDNNEWEQEWDFKNCNPNLYSHKIHDYPATFVPQLVRKIILAYSNENDTILDMFSGSGTTLVEAKILKRNCIGIDLNPLAVLLGRVKTTYIPKEKILNAYEKFCFDYASIKNIKNKKFPNIDFWFDKESIRVFSKIIATIKKNPNTDIQNLFKIAFSSIIRKISYCKHSGFKMHRDVKKTKKYSENEILELFYESLCRVGKGVSDLPFSENKHFVKIIFGNSMNVDIVQQVDLILTSPPYGDSKTTVAYGQFSKLQSLWLDLIEENEKGHVENIDALLLGGKITNISFDDKVLKKSRTLFDLVDKLKSNCDFDKKSTNRIKDVIAFYRDMDLAIKKQTSILKHGGYAVFVVASRTVRGVRLDTDKIIAEFAEHYGLQLCKIYYRNIPNKRMPMQVSPSNKSGDICQTMTQESIVILKKH